MADIIEFEQGRTFAFLGELSDTIPIGTFVGWDVEAQMRRYQNRLPTGLLANIVVEMVDPSTSNQIRLYHADTKRWPLGRAELDVKFTQPGTGYTVSSIIKQFDIVRVVTHKCP